MPPRRPRLRDVLREALNYFAQRGYRNETELQDWLLRLRAALDLELPTDTATRKELGAVLETIFKREVNSGGVQRRVPGVSRYTLERIAPSLRAELDRRIYAAVDLIKLNKQAATQKTLQRFSGWVTSIPPGGSTGNVREVATEILKPSRQEKFERRRVAIDQGHKLSAAIAHVAAQGSGAIAAIWHDRGQYDRGYDARPEHLARSGKLFLVRDNWAMAEGLLKKGGLKYTDEIEQPAELVYCFPGSTRIPLAEGVKVGYRRWYSGDLTEIVTASGKTMRATPNHPILTPKGWVACGALQKGDYVIEIAEQRVERVVPKLNDDDAEPTIAQVYGTLAKSGIARDVSGGRLQFHGDGSEENVNVIDSTRPLTFDFVTPRAHGSKKFALAMADLGRAALRALEFLLDTCTSLTPGFVSGLDAVPAPGGIAALQHNPRRLADCADYRSSRAEVRGHGESANPGLGSECVDRLSCLVASTKIVKVQRRQFSGHVYNLQTAPGWYVADGIVAHNCSCWYEYVTDPHDLPPELLTAKGRGWTRGLSLAGRADSARPTPAQIAAGNDPKGHVRIAGMDVTIETPKNALRHGVGPDGKPWSVIMPADYGYIRRTTGADGEQIDCYVGPNPDAPIAWVIMQRDLRTGGFDEHKVMLGFDSEAEAVGAYSLGFSDGMGYARLDGDELTTGVRAMPVAELRRWALAAGSVPVDRWEPRPSESAARPTPTPSQEQESSR